MGVPRDTPLPVLPGASVSQGVPAAHSNPVSWGMAPLRVLESQMQPEMQLFVESQNDLGWKEP